MRPPDTSGRGDTIRVATEASSVDAAGVQRWPIRNRDFLRVYVLRSFLPAPRPNEKGSKPCVNGNGWPQQNPYVTDDPHVD